jgi:hypothetical protein
MIGTIHLLPLQFVAEPFVGYSRFAPIAHKIKKSHCAKNDRAAPDQLFSVDFRFNGFRRRKLSIPVRFGARSAAMQFANFPGRGTTGGTGHK